MSSSLLFDPYIALGVARHASHQEIKTAYRKLVLQYHPDKIKTEGEDQRAAVESFFAVYQRAWEIIGDEDKRAKYHDMAELREIREKFRQEENDKPQSTNESRHRSKHISSRQQDLSHDVHITTSNYNVARMPFSTTVFYELQLHGNLNGRPVATFPDRGAGSNFLSRSYAEKEKFTINASEKVIVRMANRKQVQSLGTVTLPFRFKGSERDHLLKFHVLTRCVSDVVLGDTFLKVTSAFVSFGHCITRTLRQALPYRACFLGGSQHRIGGWLEGVFVGALPDTGCDLMLMSRSYARKRRLRIDDDPDHFITLQMGDLSTTETTGYVGDLEWQFGDAQGNHFGRTEDCGFWIVDNLACDVIFSDEFLLRTDALRNMAHCEYELEPDELLLGAIKAIKYELKKPTPQWTALEEWNRKLQKERLHQSEIEIDMRHMSEREKAEAQEELHRRWKALEIQNPEVVKQTGTSPREVIASEQAPSRRKLPSEQKRPGKIYGFESLLDQIPLIEWPPLKAFITNQLSRASNYK